MKKRISALILIVSVFSVKMLLSQESKIFVLDLQECEELALKNSQMIKDARLGLKVSQVKLSQANKARFLPKITLTNVSGPVPKAEGELDATGGFVIPEDLTTSIPKDLSFFTQFDLELLQPIYTFGKISGLRKAASFGMQVEEANIEKKQGDVRFQVRELYWGLVLGKEILIVITDAKNEVIKAENNIEGKLDEGSEDISQTDLWKLQIFKYEINKRHRDALDKIELAKSTLKAGLGLAPADSFEVAAEYLDPIDFHLDSLSVYWEIAFVNRSEPAQLRAGLNARMALIGASKSDYYPKFFFGAKISYNYAPGRFDPPGQYIYNPTNFFRPGFVFGLNWDLNFMQTRDRVDLAEIAYNRLAEKEKLLTAGIRLDVRKSFLELTQAAANIRESRRALKVSENWLRSTTMSWDIGVGEVKDLIDAFKANSGMRAEHLENIFKYNVALAKLSKSIGRDLYTN